MLLTTKDIPHRPKIKFSNGNSELVIAELPTVNTVAIEFYRPSCINFSLPKYREALQQVRDYIGHNSEARHWRFFLCFIS